MNIAERQFDANGRRIAATAAMALAAAPFTIALPMALAAVVGAERSFGGGDYRTEVAGIVAQPVVYSMTGVVFVALGAALIVLALAVHHALEAASSVGSRVATAAAIAGGALIVVAGLGPATLAGELGTIATQDESAAVLVYLANTLVTTRVGWAGLMLFGVFAVLASRAGARAGILSAPLAAIGFLLGIALLGGHLLPGLLAFVSVPLIVIWGAWLGFALRRTASRSVLAPA